MSALHDRAIRTARAACGSETRLLYTSLLTATLLASTAFAVPCTAPAGSDHLVCPDGVPPAPADLPITPLSAERRARMTGVSWHPGCPVSLDELSVVTVPWLDPSGQAHRGELVVATKYARTVQSIFVRLYQAAFPIARMDPIEAFGGDDDAAMAANNTSGFNCRASATRSAWSRHAYGDAIDVNPLWNPQARRDGIHPVEAAAWRDRGHIVPGMNVLGGVSVRLFRAAGWLWGGRWRRSKDYQHFTPANL